jgi:hypothetical protein
MSRMDDRVDFYVALGAQEFGAAGVEASAG